MTWRDLAACRGKPTAWFFEDAREGVEVCGGCPVRTECAAEAERNMESGVWGGRNLSPARYVASKMARPCRWCGEMFTPDGLPGAPSSYCGDACRLEGRKRQMHESYRRRKTARRASKP